ncbi:hypothetical protein D3C86_2083810 [compost metagenome]
MAPIFREEGKFLAHDIGHLRILDGSVLILNAPLVVVVLTAFKALVITNVAAKNVSFRKEGLTRSC